MDELPKGFGRHAEFEYPFSEFCAAALLLGFGGAGLKLAHPALGKRCALPASCGGRSHEINGSSKPNVSACILVHDADE